MDYTASTPGRRPTLGSWVDNWTRTSHHLIVPFQTFPIPLAVVYDVGKIEFGLQFKEFQAFPVPLAAV